MFWETFESTIQNSPALSPIKKFSYLQSLLESSAAKAVTLTEEAISTLEKRLRNCTNLQWWKTMTADTLS